MLTKLFILVLGFLATFNVSSVSALAVKRRSATPVVVGNLNTNAKRFAAGLSPLPPVRRWVPSRVDTAKRQSPSAFPLSGFIRISSASGVEGYISKTLSNGHYTLTSSLTDRAVFSTFTNLLSPTSPTLSLQDTSTPGQYLAGIIAPGMVMTSTSGSAILGRSQATNPHDPPQSGTNPTTSGDSETAIWTYTMTTAAVKPQWINPDGSAATPSTVILYDPTSNAFFLTSSPSFVTSQHPSARIVTFQVENVGST